MRVAGRVVSSTILAGMDMTGDVPGDGNSIPGAGRIGRVRIGGSLSDTTLAAGVAPGPDGRFGTSDDIASLGPAPSTIGPVTVGGRIFAGPGPGAAVVIAAADRAPIVYDHGVRFAGAARVRLLGPIARSRPVPPAASDPIAPSSPITPAAPNPIVPTSPAPPAAPNPIVPSSPGTPAASDPIDR